MKFLYFLIIFFLNQSVYAECISGDCNNGQGTYNKTNGDKYVGEFKKGKRHGNGTYYFNNGEVKKGIWENQKLIKSN